jgi:hypothetical protein
MPQQFVVEYQRERVNLVLNPSFENNAFDGTGVNTNLSVVASGAYSGTYALNLVSSSSTSIANYQTPNLAIESDKQYVGSVYVKNTDVFTRNMRVSVSQ